MMNDLRTVDPAVAAAVEAEVKRQQEGIELIASENFVSPALLETVGSVLTNKYAEGYPGRRYYGGCVHVDEVERLAIERQGPVRRRGGERPASLGLQREHGGLHG